MSWKTTTAVFVSLMLAALLVGCADVPSTGPTPPEFKAEFRFVNAAADLDGSAVSVDGANIGTLAGPGSALAYRSYNAGSRIVTITGDSIIVSMETDWRGSVFLMPEITIGEKTTRQFVKVNERRIFDSPVSKKEVVAEDGTKTLEDAPRFRIVNAINAELPVNVTLWMNDSTEVDFASDVESQKFDGYKFVDMASYTVYVTDAAGDTLTSFATGSLAAKRYTAVVWGTAGAVSGITLADD